MTNDLKRFLFSSSLNCQNLETFRLFSFWAEYIPKHFENWNWNQNIMKTENETKTSTICLAPSRFHNSWKLININNSILIVILPISENLLDQRCQKLVRNIFIWIYIQESKSFSRSFDRMLQQPTTLSHTRFTLMWDKVTMIWEG